MLYIVFFKRLRKMYQDRVGISVHLHCKFNWHGAKEMVSCKLGNMLS